LSLGIFYFSATRVTVQSTFHLVLLGGIFLTRIDFMIDSGGHAPTHATESDIGGKVNARHDCIVPLKVNAEVKTRSTASKELQAVVASN